MGVLALQPWTAAFADCVPAVPASGATVNCDGIIDTPFNADSDGVTIVVGEDAVFTRDNPDVAQGAGLFAGQGSTIINNGRFELSANGVAGGDYSSIINNGSITGDGNGVTGFIDSSIINNGEISAAGNGIFLFGTGRVSNTTGSPDVVNGTISVTSIVPDPDTGADFNIAGTTILGDTPAVSAIENNGTITGVNGTGILSLGPSAVVNTGLIEGPIGINMAGSSGSDLEPHHFNNGPGTISNSGRIVSSGQAIRSNILDVVIDNSGAIETGHTGIAAADRARIVNSGSIVADGTGSLTRSPIFLSGSEFRFSAIDLRRVTPGSVRSDFSLGVNVETAPHAENSSGISARDLADITNSGAILGADHGVNAGQELFLNNTGSIDAVLSGVTLTSGTVHNSGTISGRVGIAQRDDTDGGGTLPPLVLPTTGPLIVPTAGPLVVRDDKVSSEGGLLSTAPVTDPSITIVNSGVIRANPVGLSPGTALAIDLADAPASLALLNGSVIDGGVDMGIAGNSIHFGPGLSATIEVTGNPDDLNITFSEPLRSINGNRITQSVAPNIQPLNEFFGDLNSATSSIVQNRIDTAHAQSGSASHSWHGDADPPVSRAPRATAWTTAWGAGRKSTDGLSDETSYSGGFVGGIDRVGENDGLYGAAFGVSRISVEAEENTQVDGTGVQAGIYTRNQVGDWTLDTHFTLGYLTLDRQRDVANNAAAGGIETLRADQHAWFALPELTVSRRMDLNGTTVVPSIRAGLASVFLGGYTETGSISALRVGDRETHTATGRLQVAFPQNFGDDIGGGTITPYVGVEGRTAISDETFSVTLQNTSLLLRSDDNSTARGFVGLTFANPLGDGATLFGRAELGRDTRDATDLNVRVGFARLF